MSNYRNQAFIPSSCRRCRGTGAFGPGRFLDGWEEILERLDFEGWRAFYEARHKKKRLRGGVMSLFLKL